MIRLLLVSFLLFPLLLRAQFTYVLDKAVPLTDENQELLSAPWSGGLNAAQYNTMDLNHDNEDDLVIFDRMAQKIITYLNVNNTYQYAPEYEALFPEELLNWVLLRDYNCDGRKDLFTGDLFGIRVFTNMSDDQTLQWEHFRFYVSPTSSSDALLSQGLSGLVNVQLQFDDLPSISDVDGDGDLDIFCMKFGTAGTFELHKNLSVETYGTCDSLKFKLATQAWGNVRECHCGEMSFNGEPCTTSGRTEHAGGKSLLALDINGDANMDLLLSEGECASLWSLPNEGDIDNPVIQQFFPFPATTPAHFPVYPAPYFEDVDFDGVKDLMVSPNIFSQEPGQFINLKESNWFYKNTGTTEQPEFVLTKKNFLQETMLDVGDNAIPAFADFDADGDYDLFISNNSLPATIRLYENTGTAVSPEFTFYDDDFAGLSTYLFRNLKIQFIDVNEDGKADLVFTATSSQTASNSLYYIANKTRTGLDFTSQPLVPIPFSVSATENLLFTHVDNDAKPDILKGKSNGALEFWKNTGALNFALGTAQYLGIGASVMETNLAAAAGDLNADGKTDLILTDQTGKLRIISNYKSAADSETAMLDVVLNEQTGDYYSPNLGGRIWPTIINLYGTSKPAIVVGSILGGVRMLKNNATTEDEKVIIQVYPNPQRRADHVNILVNRVATLQVYAANGQEVPLPMALIPNQINQMPLGSIAAGIYVLRFSVGNKFYSRRLVVYE